MDAIVTAGGIPQPNDPLYAYSHGGSKALIDVAGKPMIQWVLDALGGAKHVDRVIVIGLSPRNELVCKKPLFYLSNQGRMLANIVAGINKSLELNPKSQYVLVVSSDIPALKSDMVDWLVNTAKKSHDELYYGVCPREVMEKRFPSSNRTFTKLKDIEVCGADMNVVHVNQVTKHLDTWDQLIGNRKSVFRQATIVGLDVAFGMLTRQFTLEEAAQRASERIGIKARAVVWPRAEPCMDVDKPHQLEILRADLARQQRKANPRPKTHAKAKAPKKKSAAARPTRSKKIKARAKRR